MTYDLPILAFIAHDPLLCKCRDRSDIFVLVAFGNTRIFRNSITFSYTTCRFPGKHDFLIL